MVFWGLGEGLDPALQGYTSSLVKPENSARLFTTVAFLDTLGELVSGPISGSLYSIGSGPAEWKGLCFLLSSVWKSLMNIASYQLTNVLEGCFRYNDGICLRLGTRDCRRTVRSKSGFFSVFCRHCTQARIENARHRMIEFAKGCSDLPVFAQCLYLRFPLHVYPRGDAGVAFL